VSSGPRGKQCRVACQLLPDGARIVPFPFIPPVRERGRGLMPEADFSEGITLPFDGSPKNGAEKTL
jgi:hypothetical protein